MPGVSDPSAMLEGDFIPIKRRNETYPEWVLSLSNDPLNELIMMRQAVQQMRRLLSNSPYFSFMRLWPHCWLGTQTAVKGKEA